MYNNQSYDDYIRSILGYPMPNDNSCQNGICYEMHSTAYEQQNNTSELENLYPEIYKIIYPMIKKVCVSNKNQLNREAIENMTDDIYFSIESDNVFKVEKQSDKEDENENIENRSENRQFGNRNLRDLIQVLIIRELLQNQKPNIPERPPFSKRSRTKNDFYDIYEY